MTTAEINSLIEPHLKLAKEQVSQYEVEKAAACRAGEDFTAQYALGMKRWAEGKVCAFEFVQKLLAEELGEEVNVETNIHPH